MHICTVGYIAPEGSAIPHVTPVAFDTRSPRCRRADSPTMRGGTTGSGVPKGQSLFLSATRTRPLPPERNLRVTRSVFLPAYIP
jgi:hypothetical protein